MSLEKTPTRWVLRAPDLHFAGAPRSTRFEPRIAPLCQKLAVRSLDPDGAAFTVAPGGSSATRM
jgi:hypothetical protein